MSQEVDARKVARAQESGEIYTANDRQRWIAGLKRGVASRAHIERLKLIYRPFPAVRYIGGAGSAMTWAGTIIADTFYGTNEKPVGKHGGGNNYSYDDDGYSGMYAHAVERALR